MGSNDGCFGRTRLTFCSPSLGSHPQIAVLCKTCAYAYGKPKGWLLSRNGGKSRKRNIGAGFHICKAGGSSPGCVSGCSGTVRVLGPHMGIVPQAGYFHSCKHRSCLSLSVSSQNSCEHTAVPSPFQVSVGWVALLGGHRVQQGGVRGSSRRHRAAPGAAAWPGETPVCVQAGAPGCTCSHTRR